MERRSGNRRENVDSAIASLSDAIKIVKNLPATRGVLKTYALCLIGDAKAYFELEEMGRIARDKRKDLRLKVVKQLRTAARLARRAHAFQVAIEALLLLGKSYLLIGEKARAWRALVLASRLTDRMQRRSRSYRLSRYWVGTASKIYELLVRTALECTPPPEKSAGTVSCRQIVLASAFSHAERGKTLLLQRELTNREPLPRGGTREDPLLRAFFHSRREWLGLELTTLDHEFTADFLAPTEESAARNRLVGIEAQYLKELDKVRQEYHDSDYDPDRLAPPIGYHQMLEIVARLSRTTATALIEYFISDRYLMMAVILPGVVVLKHAGISRAQLKEIEERWQDRYHNLMSGRIAPEQWEGWLRQVFDRLRPAIERATEFIDNYEAKTERIVERIVLIPHRFLHLIPFHAYELPEGLRLGQKFYLQYAPSASVLLRLMNIRLEMRKEALEHSRPAVVVAVAYPYATSKRPLIFHEEEARAVAKRQGKMISGAEATRTSVKAAIRDADYIHFACHGDFDATDPLASGLSLAPDSAGSTASDNLPHNVQSATQPLAPRDGVRLTLGDIFQNVELQRARLVVLSACETGLSRVEQRHDEYIGLPAGFLHAGATTVISSLWPVRDVATWLLMRSFVRQIRSGNSSLVALHDSQLELRDMHRDYILQEIASAAERQTDPLNRERMLEQGQQLQGEFPFESPYWWAAFTVNGVGNVVMQ